MIGQHFDRMAPSEVGAINQHGCNAGPREQYACAGSHPCFAAIVTLNVTVTSAISALRKPCSISIDARLPAKLTTSAYAVGSVRPDLGERAENAPRERHRIACYVLGEP